MSTGPRTARRRARSGRRDARARSGDRPRVLLTTDGTYPYAVGGVSSWCDLLVRNLTEFDWQLMPIVTPQHSRPAYELPPHAQLTARIELWSDSQPR